MTDREETLYRRALRLLRYVRQRWQRYSDREALARRVREKRERERAEIERVSQPGNEAEYRELARRQSEGVQPFAWTPRMAVRRDPDAPASNTSDEAIARRLWLLTRELGGTTPIPGFEAAHRHAEAAACHYAAYRQLQAWGIDEAQDRRTQALKALEKALAAYQAPDVPRDRIADELVRLTETLRSRRCESR